MVDISDNKCKGCGSGMIVAPACPKLHHKGWATMFKCVSCGGREGFQKIDPRTAKRTVKKRGCGC